MSTTEIFLIAMLLIYAVPYLVWRVGRTDYYAPLVVVQIIAGVLLGPGILGAVFPDYYRFVFTAPVTTALNGIAWWGVMLVVWLAGIELDLTQTWKHRRESGITAGLALGMPLLLGCGAAFLMMMTPGWVGTKAHGWQFVLAIGMSCAVTALPVLIILMETLTILREPLGQRMLRYASMDDVLIWGVLAVILLDWERVGKQMGFILIFALASGAFRALMRRLLERDRWPIGLIWLILCSVGADWSGLHYMVGAFLAGAIMDAHWFDRKDLDTLRHNLLFVMMPVYFLSTGLRTNWEVGGGVVFLAAALLAVASTIGKLSGLWMAGRILEWKKGEASLIGWLLQTKGLIMIVFANVLLDKAIISSESFTALLLMAVVSTMLTIPIVTPMLRRMPAVRQREK